jgi:Ca-activated chloride channel family protein
MPPAHAQTPSTPAPPAPTPITVDSSAPPVPTIEVNSRLVAVSAVVHDKAGKPVSALTRDDFTLKQDGKPQPITYLSQGSDLPLTLALMVDTSGSQRAYIQDEIAAGRAFFPAMLTRPDDRAVLVQFDDRVLQLAALTGNQTTLEHALAYLTQSHADIGAAGQGGTLLYDAVCAVSRLELGTQMGRRAMIILTDGADNGSHFKQKQAIEAAQRADIVIYTIYYSRGGGDEGVLRNLSKATGGREFAVGPVMTLAAIYAQIAEDMRLQYQFGYAPPDTRPDKYHKIDLQPKDKAYIVQAREGYFTPK